MDTRIPSLSRQKPNQRDYGTQLLKKRPKRMDTGGKLQPRIPSFPRQEPNQRDYSTLLQQTNIRQNFQKHHLSSRSLLIWTGLFSNQLEVHFSYSLFTQTSTHKK